MKGRLITVHVPKGRRRVPVVVEQRTVDLLLSLQCGLLLIIPYIH